MLLIDPEDGSILDANEAAVRFYGYSKAQMISIRISDINILPELEIKKDMAIISEGQGQRFEFIHRLADGTLREAAVSSSSILFNGRPIRRTRRRALFFPP